MYMPVWGTLLILALCLLCIVVSGAEYIKLFISDYPDTYPVRAFFALFVLLVLMLSGVILGYDAIVFNKNHDIGI